LQIGHRALGLGPNTLMKIDATGAFGERLRDHRRRLA